MGLTCNGGIPVVTFGFVVLKPALPQRLAGTFLPLLSKHSSTKGSATLFSWHSRRVCLENAVSLPHAAALSSERGLAFGHFSHFVPPSQRHKTCALGICCASCLTTADTTTRVHLSSSQLLSRQSCIPKAAGVLSQRCAVINCISPCDLSVRCGPAGSRASGILTGVND